MVIHRSPNTLQFGEQVPRPCCLSANELGEGGAGAQARASACSTPEGQRASWNKCPANKGGMGRGGGGGRHQPRNQKPDTRHQRGCKCTAGG